MRAQAQPGRERRSQGAVPAACAHRSRYAHDGGNAVRSPRRSYFSAMKGYVKSRGGANVSLIVRALTQRTRFSFEPALSFVPDPRAPPNGCWPTTAPVGLSLM